MPDAQKELPSIPAEAREKIIEKIRALTSNPRPPGCKAMKGAVYRGCTRIRSGDYLIIYIIEDQKLVIVVVKIGNRREIYDR